MNYYRYFFFFNDTATTEIYTLSLHDALPISPVSSCASFAKNETSPHLFFPGKFLLCQICFGLRSEEHTSELQSQSNLVCRLLLEKKKSKFIIKDSTECAAYPTPRSIKL